MDRNKTVAIMEAALQAVDVSWSKTFPEGPDGNPPDGMIRIFHEHATAWRQVRAALTDQINGKKPTNTKIEMIKREHFEALKNRRVILIVEAEYGYQVEQWAPDGVAPTSDYDTAQEAVARACQLLKLKEPVRPQSWPEIAQIGGPPAPPPPPKR